jgi:hypothetical protein
MQLRAALQLIGDDTRRLQRYLGVEMEDALDIAEQVEL